VDASQGADNEAGTESVRKIHASAPELPVMMWADGDDPGRADLASRAGAQGCVTAETSPEELARLLAGVLDVWQSAEPGASDVARAPAKATVIAVMGVKGGVGTTTVAMNVAAALTGRGSVILAEIRPTFGSLHAYLNPGRMIRGFTNRQNGDGAAHGAMTSLLWPLPTVAGLRVLFGPQSSEDCVEIEPASASTLLLELAAEADFVVADLPPSLSDANRAILGASHYLTLVVEPVPVCMRLGKLTLEAIRGWEKTPASIGTAVVKQGWESAPVPLAEIETELGIPIQTVVPPAPELRLQGQRTRVPMIQCDLNSLVADSFITLARGFHLQKSPAAAR
jgi:pilus assembly protein CpaE